MSMSQEQDNTVDTTVEEQTSQETVEETTQTTDTVSKEEYEKLQETNKQLYARLQKAQQPSSAAKEETTNQASTGLTSEQVEVMFLQRDGITAEEIDMLKTIQLGNKAQGKDVTLTEAMQDPLYASYKQNKDMLAKQEAAQVGAARGGRTEKQSTMTPEEHKDFARKKSLELLEQL